MLSGSFNPSPQLTSAVLKQMEDALVKFVLAGRLDFDWLAQSIRVDYAGMVLGHPVAKGDLRPAGEFAQALQTINGQQHDLGHEFGVEGKGRIGVPICVLNEINWHPGESIQPRAKLVFISGNFEQFPQGVAVLAFVRAEVGNDLVGGESQGCDSYIVPVAEPYFQRRFKLPLGNFDFSNVNDHVRFLVTWVERMEKGGVR